jgi:hypothetical protein
VGFEVPENSKEILNDSPSAFLISWRLK